jgi:hypothetical protein
MSSEKTRPKPDFGNLWSLMISESERTGNDRVKSAFLNNSSRKEYVCRKFGIISAADVSRLASVKRRRAQQ